MKKISRFLAVILLSGLVLSWTGIIAAAETSDLDGHWAQVHVRKWVNVGLLQGYPDGNYYLDNKITRAEFVTLVNKAFRQRSPEASCNFNDVKPDDWFYQAVATGTTLKYISGYPDKTFKPNQGLSRQEFAAIVAKLLSLRWIEEDLTSGYRDSEKIADWSEGLVNTVVYHEIMTGYPDGTFRAEGQITRGEAVVAFDKALSIVRSNILPDMTMPQNPETP